MAKIETWFNQDLKEAVKVQYIDGNLFSADNNGNIIGVNVFDDGEPATLGGSVAANVIRSDGVTIAVDNGVLSWNQAYVVLPQSAYDVPGVISIIIKLTSGSTVTTLCAVVANVYQSSTSAVVDPGTIIPSVEALIAEIEAAVATIPADYSTLWESLAPTFSTSTSYAIGQFVTYDGKLYRFKNPHSGTWVASDAVATNIGEHLYDSMIAICHPFSTSTTYKIGDYIYYAGKIRMFIANHPAGAWIGNDTTVVTDIADLAKKIINEIATIFSQTSTYKLDDLVMYGASLCKCIAPVTVAGAWTGTANWETTSVNNEIYRLKKIDNDIQDNCYFDNTNVLKISNLDSGKYWSNGDGVKAVSANYSCSHELIKVNPDFITGASIVSENNCDVYMTMFNKNMELTGYIKLFGRTARGNNTALFSKTVPSGVYYIGLSANGEPSAESITIRILENTPVVEYPFTNDNNIYLTNYWRTSSGAYQSIDNLDCVVIPGVKPGEKYYTNATASTTLQFFDGINDTPLTASIEEIPHNGKIFTAPANTTYATFNIQHNKTHGGSSAYSTLVYKMTKNTSILCIGDSITWLDNRQDSQYDGATLFLGWQKQLLRDGYKVSSMGYSGYTYAKDVTSGGSSIGSIYTKIVTEEVDVSSYDMVILAGGTNDDLYNVTVGSIPTDYNHTFTEAELKTTLGALGAIIQYIRANNTTCKIIVCSQNKSEASARGFSEAVQYANGFNSMSQYASCFFCDLFRNMNVQPFTDGFDLFYYDSTHPNKSGMQRMGQLVLKAVANC